jgi:hypothetical protein
MSNPLFTVINQGRKDARRGRALPETLHALTGTGAARSVVREAEQLGVAANDVRKVADRTAELEAQAKIIDKVEKEMVELGQRLKTTAAILRKEGKAPDEAALGRMFRSFSAKDKHFLAELATRLAGKDTQFNMAGAIREIVAKHLPDLRREVIESVVELRKSARSGKGTAMLDTGTRGPVHLPTALKDGKREIELGTDRLIGAARGDPQRVEVQWPSGAKERVWVAGELEVTVAIEVKGRTNALAGVQQIEALQSRGMRGYAMIDGKLWLLKYDASKVKHLVVAPPGKGLDAVKAVTKLKSGAKLKAIEIPLDVDNQIQAMARYFLQAAKAR